MLRLVLVAIALVRCEAGYDHGGGYGGHGGEVLSGGLGGGLGGHQPILTGGLSRIVGTPIGLSHGSIGYGLAPVGLGLAAPIGLGIAPIGLAVPHAHLPVHAHRSVEVAPIALDHQPRHPEVIEVTGDDQPVQVIFRSLGTRVHVQQVHTPSGPGQVESTRSEEEPHRVLHEVIRPVIQEVREVIQPYRRLTQEIRPVQEEVHTVVAKGEHRAHGLSGAPVLLATGLDSANGLSASGYKSKKA